MNMVRRYCKLAASALGGLALCLFPTLPAVAQLNQALMMKWASLTVVHFEVVGDFTGEVMVVGAATNGIAQVTDHLELSFDYDQTSAQLVGKPVIRNSPSKVSQLRNGAEGCTPPTLEGPYEHWTVESIQAGYSGQPELIVRTDYPAAQMPFSCRTAFKAVTAKQEIEHFDFPVPGVMVLALGAEAESADLKVAKDRKSFSVTRGGWTFVYTPTPPGEKPDSDLQELQLER